jgi:hypothetical protein
VVRLLAALVGREVVGLVEVDGIHLVERDELGDVHGLRGLLLERLELVGGEGDVLVLGELVALDHVVARDDHLLLRADVLLLEARAALLVQEVERDPRRGDLRGGKQLHRDRDEPERDGGTGDGARWHGGIIRSPAETRISLHVTTSGPV